MVQVHEFHFDSSDNKTRIHAVKWMADDIQPRAILQLAHGIAEYAMRYDEFARFFAEQGFVVVANDHLGHGSSFSLDKNVGFFAERNGWNTVTADLFTLSNLAKREHPDIPHFLLGHSMGSFLARTFLIQYPGATDGCLLSGTGNQPAALCTAGIALARLIGLFRGKRYHSTMINNLCFGSYTAKLENVRTAYDWLSRDEAVVNKYILDPLCGFIPSVGLVSDMLGGIKFITNGHNLDQMDVDTPVFFYAGEMDPVGDYGKGVHLAHRSFVNTGCKDVSLKLYPKGRHEMHNELNKDEVCRDVLQWLEKHI